MKFVCAMYFIISISNAANGESNRDQVDTIASRSQYNSQATSFQTEFPYESIMATSLEMAIQSCQANFQWHRWNCPRTDFYMRHLSRPYLLDREDSYVQGIMTAAILYSITKSCTDGHIAGCGCRNAQRSPGLVPSQCNDNPQEALDLYQANIGIQHSNDFSGSAKMHNFKAVTTLLQQSLVTQCVFNADSGENVCIEVLKTFEEIAQDIQEMYNEGLQLTIGDGENSQVMWQNIPLDSLVYMKDSPNYCEPDAVPFWNGVRGRQCQMDLDDDSDKSCASLCFGCGHQIESRQVVKEHRCNCQFTWAYQVHCDICITVEEQYYCN